MKNKIQLFLLFMIYIIFGLIIIGFIALEIYCWIHYGSLPPEDVPSWVHWLMWRR